MKIVLVTGGARSGKSRYARKLARAEGGDDVTVIATARASDEEMERRIRAHRNERPAAWTTLEEPVEAGAALREAATGVVLLDCLTLLIANRVRATEPSGPEDAVDAAVAATRALLDGADDRSGTLVVVTNEVGMGVVPPTPLGRWFRDAQGRANQMVAEVAGTVVLMVSGQPLVVKPEGGEL